jgi:cytochrome c-type biogenesis protein CcmH
VILATSFVTLALAIAMAPEGTPSPAPTDAPDLVTVSQTVGMPRGQALTGTALERETLRVASLLRCPVCQGLSVADSPAETAVNMRHRVHELLALGFSEAQILSYFERSYGEFVRLEPPLRGFNWALWLAPGAALLLGAGLLWWRLRAAPPAETPETSAAVADGDPLPADPCLADYVRRVRAAAFGWPDGVRPGAVEKQ